MEKRRWTTKRSGLQVKPNTPAPSKICHHQHCDLLLAHICEYTNSCPWPGPSKHISLSMLKSRFWHTTAQWPSWRQTGIKNVPILCIWLWGHLDKTRGSKAPFVYIHLTCVSFFTWKNFGSHQSLLNVRDLKVWPALRGYSRIMVRTYLFFPCYWHSLAPKIPYSLSHFT